MQNPHSGPGTFSEYANGVLLSVLEAMGIS